MIPTRVAVLGRVVAQVADDVLDAAERDPVAQPLLRPEHASAGCPGPRSCTRPTGSPPGSTRRGSAGRRGSSTGSRRRRAPSAGPAPRRARRARRPGPAARDPLELVGHPRQLGDAVALRERREDRLVQAAAQELDLAALDERAQPLEEVRALGARSTRAAAPCSGATGGRPGGARAPRASAGRRGRRPRRTPSRSCPPAGGCGSRGPARCGGPRMVLCGRRGVQRGVVGPATRRRGGLAASAVVAGGRRRQVQPLDVLVEHAGRREPPDRCWRSSCASARASARAGPCASRS